MPEERFPIGRTWERTERISKRVSEVCGYPPGTLCLTLYYQDELGNAWMLVGCGHKPTCILPGPVWGGHWVSMTPEPVDA